ncbi:MAG: TFIIB-type zinc ribbon-containing protein [Erysipelotrichaceae bacterium]|nr:TFIIB-type zinc ribbon-containing protein [Erysipelotrichaceae bacterium]
MKTIYLTRCPNCSAELDYEFDREELFCKYCGTKINLKDINSYVVKKIEDDPKEKKENNQPRQVVIDYENNIHVQQLKRQEKRLFLFNSFSFFFGLLTMLVFTYGVVSLLEKGSNFKGWLILFVSFYMLVLNLASYERAERENKIVLKQSANIDRGLGKQIEIPDSLYRSKGKNYEKILQEFSSLGFRNVECIPLKDLSKFGLSSKEGRVKSVTIGGEEIAREEVYLSNEKVVIYYSSKAQ